MFRRAVLYYPYNMQIIRRAAMSTDAKRAGNARYLATQKLLQYAHDQKTPSGYRLQQPPPGRV